MKIKPEVSPRAGSDFPQFDARIKSGKTQQLIYPFTGEIGDRVIGTHIHLETLQPVLENRMAGFNIEIPALRR